MKKRSAFGWVELIIGLALIAFGIFTFARPASALKGIVFIYGIMAIVTGVVDILFYVKMEQHTGFGPSISLVTGILSCIAGIVLLFNPGTGTWVMVILFPLWFIVHCISQLTHLPTVRIVAGTGYYYFTLVVNILGLLLGFAMIFNPVLSFLSVSYIIGFYLALIGLDYLVLGVSNFGTRR